MVIVYNTLKRSKEVFKPRVKDKVGMYSCGPTVYWYQHIGNMRTYIFSDILKRVLQYNGFTVDHIINVTDVGHLTATDDEGADDSGDDKMELAAAREGKTAQEIADHYLQIFIQDCTKLNILSPTKWVKATDHIAEQITLIQKLEKKGFTYITKDGIYFDSSKFNSYAELGRLNLEGLESGKRVSQGEKRNKTDFALWKFSEKPGKRQQEWESPWGLGFPGWHIECSAMSMKYLGEHFDIHTGGEDHVQVHHTNEIAQSEAATGKKFVNYWLHGAFLTTKGEKVSKSKGGLYTLAELEELGYSALEYRYLCLLTHYRKPLDFTLDHLNAAKTALGRMQRKIVGFRTQKHVGADHTAQYKQQFLEAVNDDLNIPAALQVVHKVIDDEDFDPQKKLKLLYSFDKVLGLGFAEMQDEVIAVPADIQAMIDEREQYRKEKDFAKADIVRDRIRERGFELEDSPDGPVARKI